nr:hypothetical protein CFP56_26058 [Quercus suber]
MVRVTVRRKGREGGLLLLVDKGREEMLCSGRMEVGRMRWVRAADVAVAVAVEDLTRRGRDIYEDLGGEKIQEILKREISNAAGCRRKLRSMSYQAHLTSLGRSA